MSFDMTRCKVGDMMRMRNGCACKITHIGSGRERFPYTVTHDGGGGTRTKQGYVWSPSTTEELDIVGFAEEENMTKVEKLQRNVDRMEAELASMKQQLETMKKPKKGWPDTFEEAAKISVYWGFDVLGCRFMVPCSGTLAGAIVGPLGRWCSSEEMKMYWAGDGGDVVGVKYSFHKFDSASELLIWMSKGRM